MIKAMTAKLAASQRQRSVMHTRETVLSYVPKNQPEQIEAELKAVFSQKSRQEADQAVVADHWRNSRTSLREPSRVSKAIVKLA